MNNIQHVDGKDCGKIMLYALSTCIWCRKTRQFLTDKGIAFDYVHVDLLKDEEKAATKNSLKEWNPDCSYPTMVINNEKCIIGFDEDQMMRELNI